MQQSDGTGILRVAGSLKDTLLVVALSAAIVAAVLDDQTASASAKASESQAEPRSASALTPAASPGRIYGPGINIDSRSNRRVSGGLGLAHRFRAGSTAKVRAILFQPRWGSGYSGGDGGRYSVSIQTNDASNGDVPSGRILASFVWNPGRGPEGGHVRRFRFASPAKLQKGRIYHVVFHNTHRAPDANYVSINEVFTFQALTPRQPRYADGIYAVLNGSRAYGSGTSWSVDPRHTPVMDIEYANGRHQGMAYLGPMVSGWGAIGGDRMVRERFTVRGKDRRVTGACVRVGRQRGTGPLMMRLGSNSGNAIESISIRRSSAIPVTTPGHSNASNGDWVCGRFERARPLRKGRTYDLRLSAPSGTQYSMTPLLARDYTTDNLSYHMRSFHFRAGTGQKSTDGGRSWSPLYRWYPQNMQFYFVMG